MADNNATDVYAYEEEYEEFSTDVLGNQEQEKKSKSRFLSPGRDDEEEEEEEDSTPLSATFDFRRGPNHWPEGAEVVSSEKAEELMKSVEEEAKQLNDQLKNKGQGAAGGAGADDFDALGWTGRADAGWGWPGAGAGADPMVGWRGGTGHNRYHRGYGRGYDSEDDDPRLLAEAAAQLSPAPTEAVFETLKDGSTALVIQPGQRLKLDLRELTDYGHAMKEIERQEKKEATLNKLREAKREERERLQQERLAQGLSSDDPLDVLDEHQVPEAKELPEIVRMEHDDDGSDDGILGGVVAFDTMGRERNGWDDQSDTVGQAKGGAAWAPAGARGGKGERQKTKDYRKAKTYLDVYTISMDVKLKEDIPQEGISLFQTSLVHTEENPRTGRVKLKQSDGEGIVNNEGGVGVLGSYGDTTNTRLSKDVWKRVVIAVECAQGGGKGRICTWIDAERCTTIKNEEILSEGRFSMDPESLFLFSSNKSTMMPGGIALRFVRVSSNFISNEDVRKNRARDQIVPVFMENREKDVDDQRRGLVLSELFPKPRPIWSAPALTGTFGDAFLEGTSYEASSLIGWSFTVLYFTIRKAMRNQKLYLGALSHGAKVAVADVVHILAKSQGLMKQVLKLMMNGHKSQLLGFLRKLRTKVVGLNVGESVLLPLLVEGKELMIIVIRSNEQHYRFVVVQTDAEGGGLKYHPVSPTSAPPKLKYRTCLVLSNISKKNARDNVFWLALYNLTISSHEGDMDKFYNILLPFLTGKPLDASLKEAEEHSLKYENGEDGFEDDAGWIGSWRTPQRSMSSHVRCLYESIHYLLRLRGLSKVEAKSVSLAVRAQFLEFVDNDMNYIHPGDNGQRVCRLSTSQLSYSTVKLVESMKTQMEEEKKQSDPRFRRLLELTEGRMYEDLQEYMTDLMKHTMQLVEKVNKKIEACENTELELPPRLVLRGPDVEAEVEGAQSEEKQASGKQKLIKNDGQAKEEHTTRTKADPETPEGEKQMISVKVKHTLPRGDPRPLQFKVNANGKVSALLQMIKKVTNVPVASQRLVFMGKILKAENTLTSYKVNKNGLVLHLALTNLNKPMNELEPNAISKEDRKNIAKDEKEADEHVETTKRFDMQFQDLLAWDTSLNTPNPGVVVALNKYVPVNFLQLPERVETRDQAVEALRICDQLCTLLDNQSHCIKNEKFLIAALIQYVMLELVPTPKPRNIRLSKSRQKVAARRERRERRKFAAWQDMQRALDEGSDGGKEKLKAFIKEGNIVEAKYMSEELYYRAEIVLVDIDTETVTVVFEDGEECSGLRFDSLKPVVKEQKKNQWAKKAAVRDAGAVEDDSDESSYDSSDEDSVADEEDEGAEARMNKKRVQIGTTVLDEEETDGVEPTEKEDEELAQAALEKLIGEDCIWDQPITYELQLELVICLQRLMEHLIAAVMSIQQCRSFDSVIICTAGVMATISDAVMRLRATNMPSVPSCHLMGQTRAGKQLGIFGYGLSVATFAEQTENMEVHSPEACLARTAILDYFHSPEQAKLDKIMSWENSFHVRPNKPLREFLTHLNREIASNESHEQTFELVDGLPKTSLLMKNFPELEAYRDVVFWWKYLLNPDVTSFFNYIRPTDMDQDKELGTRHRLKMQLVWGWDEDHKAYTVAAGGSLLRCRPLVDQNAQGSPVTEQMVYRYPSTATPSFYATDPPIKTEDDVIYRPTLPGFSDTTKPVLGQYDSELLLSYLTVPYLRLPLVLTFFASDDRLHKLQSKQLKGILDAVMFEPGRYLAVNREGVRPSMVPTTRPDLLASSFGMLINELQHSPDTVLKGVSALLKGALALDTGSVCDDETDDFNTGVAIILYVARFAARLVNYLTFLIDVSTGTHPTITAKMRGVHITPDCLEKLAAYRKSISATLLEDFQDLMEDYLRKLDDETRDNPGDEEIIDRNSLLACDLHSHRILMHRNLRQAELTVDRAQCLIGSFVYLTTRHTWNKGTREGGKLLIPETELYEVLQHQKRSLVQWCKTCMQGDLDTVMQYALQVSTSTTGSLRASSELVDGSNRWSRIKGDDSIGRYAVSSSRSGGSRKPKKPAQSVFATAPTSARPALARQLSENESVGLVPDNDQLGVEMDLQIGQTTLRRRHLSALPSVVAGHRDVRLLFGTTNMQASLLEKASNCQKYRLVGLQHEVVFWSQAHSDFPPMGEEWARPYDPAELFDSEYWIPPLFEPVRTQFFAGPIPPPMLFMMLEWATPENAEVAVLLGLSQATGGPFKLVYVFRRLKCVHVYQLISHGHQWWWCLHLTTDVRYTLREMQPSTGNRAAPPPKWWERGAGTPYPPTGNADSMIFNAFTDGWSDGRSVVISREPAHPDNLSGGTETMVPMRLLYGMVPQCLLSDFIFWQDESWNTKPRSRFGRNNHPVWVIRGYPKKYHDQDHVLVIELQRTGSFLDLRHRKPSLAEPLESPNGGVDIMGGLPGRTLRIKRVLMSEARANFKRREKLATLLESLDLLAKTKRAAAKAAKVKERTLQSVLRSMAKKPKKSSKKNAKAKNEAVAKGKEYASAANVALDSFLVVGQPVKYYESNDHKRTNAVVVGFNKLDRTFDIRLLGGPNKGMVIRHVDRNDLEASLTRGGLQRNALLIEQVGDVTERQRYKSSGGKGREVGRKLSIDNQVFEHDLYNSDRDDQYDSEDAIWDTTSEEEETEDEFDSDNSGVAGDLDEDGVEAKRRRSQRKDRLLYEHFNKLDLLYATTQGMGSSDGDSTQTGNEASTPSEKRVDLSNPANEEGQEDQEATTEEEEILHEALFNLAAVPGQKFSTVEKLAEAVKMHLELRGLKPAPAEDPTKANTSTAQGDYAAVVSTSLGTQGCKLENIDVLLNLLYAPRRSRLFSLAKTLTRVENLSHIAAWTKQSSVMADQARVSLVARQENSGKTELHRRGPNMVGCPSIDLVELPRLKLSFTTRRDHEGVLRLYSLDHADLFVTNVRNPLTVRVLRGIPHSLLMSNSEGETQVLVPVLSLRRPHISQLPFSTQLVVDRVDRRWYNSLSQRYFLYPMHVSMSFLLTRGVESALYLMLMRFLHRDYEEVFRLSDSVATDTSFSAAGTAIYNAFANAETDCHPDAHACRLKISLVTIDANIRFPWEISSQFAKYIVKLPHVSAVCRMSLEEELQLLESTLTPDCPCNDKSSPAYKTFRCAIVKNRLHVLRAVFGSDVEEKEVVVKEEDELGRITLRLEDRTDTNTPSEATKEMAELEQKADEAIAASGGMLVKAKCFAPPRVQSDNWPYYMDNTVFGEVHAEVFDLKQVSFLDSYITDRGVTAALMQKEEAPLSVVARPDAVPRAKPAQGWLSVICFYVLWSETSANVMSKLSELAPVFPQCTFVTVESNRSKELEELSRGYKVTTFPTLLVLRDGKEVDRISGDRVIERTSKFLTSNISPDDHKAYFDWANEERRLARHRRGSDELSLDSDDEGNEDEEVQWTWDVEQCGASYRIEDFGMAVTLFGDEDDDINAVWEFRMEYEEGDWEPFSAKENDEIEAQYKKGLLYSDEIRVSGLRAVTMWDDNVEIRSRLLTGIQGEFDDGSGVIDVRRRGMRLVVPGEPERTQREKLQDQNVARLAEQMVARKRYYAMFRRGRDVEAAMGSVGFVPKSGKHKWTIRWQHEPVRNGSGDGVGLCADSWEHFGPTQEPCLGGPDEASSIGLYANGDLYFNGKRVAKVPARIRKKLLERVADIKRGEQEKRDRLEQRIQELQKKLEKKAAKGGSNTLAFALSKATAETKEEEENEKKKEGEEPEVSEDDEGVNSDEADDDDEEEEDDDDKEEDEEEDEEDDDKEDDVEEDEEQEKKLSSNTSETKSVGESEPKKMTKAEKRLEKQRKRFEKILPMLAQSPLALGNLAKVELGESPNLWGQSSEITVYLDTEVEGGVLEFEVDGIMLEEVRVSNVFNKLGSTVLYPSVCMAPQDEPDMQEDERDIREQARLEQLREQEQSKKKKKKDKERKNADSDDEAEEEGEEEGKQKEDLSSLLRQARQLTGLERRFLKTLDKKTLKSVIKTAEDLLVLQPKKPTVAILGSDSDPLGMLRDWFRRVQQRDAANAKRKEQEKQEVFSDDDDSDASSDYSDSDEEEVKEEDAPQEAADEESVPIANCTWMHKNSSVWFVYPAEVCRSLEQARREGRKNLPINVGGKRFTVRFGKNNRVMSTQVSENGEEREVRRQVVSEGLAGQWEVLSMAFKPVMALYGHNVLDVLERVWAGEEGMSGLTANLGFLFLYTLLQGQVRCKIISTSWWESGGSAGSSSSDSHRLGVLLSQLYYDRKRKSLPGSVINVLARNRQLCARLPKFRDTRKNRRVEVFNGWSDESEPRSPLAELFTHVVPTLQDLRRRRGAMQFPPRPPHPELAPPPPFQVVDKRHYDAEVNKALLKPELSNFGCDRRTLQAVSPQDISRLSHLVHHSIGKDERYVAEPPLALESPHHLREVLLVCKAEVVALQFTATWSGPCQAVEPIGRVMSKRLPFVRFLTLDVDDCDHMAQRLGMDALPSVKFYRLPVLSERSREMVDKPGGNYGLGNPVAVIRGAAQGGHEFQIKFLATLLQIATQKELEIMSHSVFADDGLLGTGLLNAVEHSAELMRVANGGAASSNDSAAENIARLRKGTKKAVVTQQSEKELVKAVKQLQLDTSEEQVKALASRPLTGFEGFLSFRERTERGETQVQKELPFNLHKHDASKSVVAKSMLHRLENDMVQWGDFAENERSPELTSLMDQYFTDFFQGQDGTSNENVQKGREDLNKLLQELRVQRNSDARMVEELLPLLKKVADFIALQDDMETSDKQARLQFQLRRISGQEPRVWVEFLFGLLLSTKAEVDLRKINPFVTGPVCESLLRLVAVVVLRSSRVGHANRAIGAGLKLLKLLDSALAVPAGPERLGKMSAMLPGLRQARDAVAGQLACGRHYIDQATMQYDPRFMVFEFTWNIMLRRKQVEIVNMFMSNVDKGVSKVKQMIMGAGKTTVVAPLLALMLANGDSLVLSVVPKALLEMSRKRMRETFATIMQKRVYTLKFDRSTTIEPSMYRSLQNAARNRGIVVATPTAVKSIMLSYVENLGNLKRERRALAAGGGVRKNTPKMVAIQQQVEELAKVLQLFRNGAVLLDEVDLILHPLKSELNFPIGEKFDLDATEHGERWLLPMHLLDAIFFADIRRVCTFEQRGTAATILKRLDQVIRRGYDQCALQSLPHITLLNHEFYHDEMKPVLAEWSYLWLQNEHLHGIEYEEAIRFVLQGAVARSETASKVEALRRELDRWNESHADAASGGAVERRLTEAIELAKDHAFLTDKVYELEQDYSEFLARSSERIVAIEEKIAATTALVEEAQYPRDDSLDNSVVVWCAGGFNTESGQQNSAQVDEAQASVVEIECAHLEDMGFTVKRCSSVNDAVAISRELISKCQLRAIVVGGNARKKGCPPTCSRNHRRHGNCLTCGSLYSDHSGHTCPNGGQGRWFTSTYRIGSVDLELAFSIIFNEKNSVKIPKDRVIAFGADKTLNVRERLECWNEQIDVAETTSSLISLVDAISDYPESAKNSAREDYFSDEEDDERFKAPENSENELGTGGRARALSDGTLRLQHLRARLKRLEAAKSTFVTEEEKSRKEMKKSVSEAFEKLRSSIDTRIQALQGVIENVTVLSQGKLHPPPRAASMKASAAKAMQMKRRDHSAAFALSFLDEKREELETVGKMNGSLGDAEKDLLVSAQESLVLLEAECEHLEHTALAAKVVAFVSLQHKKLLNLTHDWLRTFMPHCLAKVNRVSFGLLNEEDCEAALAVDELMPRSRLKLAVPFVGKDVPSAFSEFAHPDVIIGLTILAYRYSGLRRTDFDDIIDSLTTDFSHEIGPASERASTKKHELWVRSAGGRLRGMKQNHRVLTRAEKRQKLLDDSRLVGTQSAEARAREEVLASKEAAKEVVQLKYLQQSNSEQTTKLFLLWQHEPHVVHDYLHRFIFPAHMRSQKLKISASGQAVGGDMLFGKRVGFSGTPSDLLPKELGKCDYETGDDGKMLATVLDPNITSYSLLNSGWSVPWLINHIANAKPRFNALIDTGALITGYSNELVARILLNFGLDWCEGVVFLDKEDKQQVIVRATGRVVAADQCGIPLEKRFAFYDQIHTTGMDISHVVNARAVVTLGKDMVFRDYVQGIFRMRGIGQGQKVTVFIIPEVLELIRREMGAGVTTTLDGPALLEAAAAGEAPKGDAQTKGKRRSIRAVVAAAVMNRRLSLSRNSLSRRLSRSLRRSLGSAEEGPPGRGRLESSNPIFGSEESDLRHEVEAEEMVTTAREVVDDATDDGQEEHDVKMLVEVVAWLVINSMRSEQVQWTMLSLQNLANLYRKNAFHKLVVKRDDSLVDTGAGHAQPQLFEQQVMEQLARLDHAMCTEVFDEPVDYTVEATVPDPIPFSQKLRKMLSDNDQLILTPTQREIGEAIVQEVEMLSELDREKTSQQLESEQEREQEQEQEKEVKAKRDQQMEVEKFVDRQYSRTNEKPKPWAFRLLGKGPPLAHETEHPFTPLSNFKLLHQEPMKFPAYLYFSNNYFNPEWNSLRRVKNVVMVLEWAPSTGEIHVLPPKECRKERIISSQEALALDKAYQLLAAKSGVLGRDDLASAVRAATDVKVSDEQLDRILKKFGKSDGSGVDLKGLQKLLTSGILRPEEKGRYFIAVSLAEAETIKRILHVTHGNNVKKPTSLIKGRDTELALRYTPLTSYGTSNTFSEEGLVMVQSHGWTEKGTVTPHTGVSHYQSSVAHNCMRFLDCNMHFNEPSLHVLIRALQENIIHERERFFFTTIGCRRRLERKWQDTPLAKLFTTSDEWALLKQRAQAVFMREAIADKGLTLWEAFNAFDADDNGVLNPAEFYGALRWLGIPNLTPDDVVDMIESADMNRDGMVDYKEYITMLRDPDDVMDDAAEMVEEEVPDKGASTVQSVTTRSVLGEPAKPAVEPYGADMLREVMVARKRQEMELVRLDKLKRQAFEKAMDIKVFEAELAASSKLRGGSNPRLYSQALAAASASVCEFVFNTHQKPLRMNLNGLCKFAPVYGMQNLTPAATRSLSVVRCDRGHRVQYSWSGWYPCVRCGASSSEYYCGTCPENHHWCAKCYRRMESATKHALDDLSEQETFLQCAAGSSFSLQVPARMVAKEGEDPTAVEDVALERFTVTMEVNLARTPPPNQLHALVRFFPANLGRSRRRHMASVYVNEHGLLTDGVALMVPEHIEDDEAADEPDGEASEALIDTSEEETTGSQSEASEASEESDDSSSEPDEEEGDSTVRVKERTWHLVTIAVDAEEGVMTTFVDGKQCTQIVGLNKEDTTLKHQLVVFGGAKQGHMRGGSIRRLIIHDKVLTAEDIGDMEERVEFEREAHVVWCSLNKNRLHDGVIANLAKTGIIVEQCESAEQCIEVMKNRFKSRVHCVVTTLKDLKTVLKEENIDLGETEDENMLVVGSDEKQLEDVEQEGLTLCRAIRKEFPDVPIALDVSAPPKPERTFILDEKVSAKFKGKNKWYSGVITKVDRETNKYSVHYDDGDEEHDVSARMIRPQHYVRQRKRNKVAISELELQELKKLGNVTVACELDHIEELVSRSLWQRPESPQDRSSKKRNKDNGGANARRRAARKELRAARKKREAEKKAKEAENSKVPDHLFR